MHWDIGQIIIILVYALLFLLCISVAVFVFWAGFLSLRYVDPNESRKGYIARGLALCAMGFFILYIMTTDLLMGLSVTRPLWLKIVSDVIIGLALALISVSIALMLPGEIAKMRSAARKARESGEGFWVSRHNDG